MYTVVYAMPSGASFTIDDKGVVTAVANVNDNVLTIKNASPAGYSCIEFQDSSGNERLFVGHGNPQSGCPDESYILTAKNGQVPSDLVFYTYENNIKHGALRIRGNGDVVVGDNAMPTDAAHGHFVIPACVGDPTGDAPEGALIRNVNNQKLYMRGNGVWSLV